MSFSLFDNDSGGSLFARPSNNVEKPVTQKPIQVIVPKPYPGKNAPIQKPNTEVKEEPVKVEEQKEPEQPKNRYPLDPISMKNTIDSLEDLEKEVSKMFESFVTELQTLRRSNANYENICMDDESILDGVVHLVEESKKQEVEMIKSSDEIDRLLYESTAQDAQMEARHSVARVITQLDEEIARNSNLQSQYEKLQNELDNINKEIISVQNGEKTSGSYNSANQDLKNEIKELESEIQLIRTQRVELEAQTAKIKENNKLNDKPIVTYEEAMKFKTESQAGILNYFRELVASSYKSLSQSFDGKTEVSKEEIIEALQKAFA